MSLSYSAQVIGIAILGFLLIGLMVMDWQTQRLPDAFTLTGIGISFLLTCVQAFFLAPGEGDTVEEDQIVAPAATAADPDPTALLR